ncbi:TetR/AcrR family transcriptional regulator [Pseudomonas lopnurensis]|uniref:TetR/AcrR family transcriptional regulator n=1 Tax=Pseudomonas lopnurensis TaxID=1477517 RepID=UPI0028B04F38|nr:TetR/AcrR family transcriptional regulator [Pseudomonas lopnurensis]
MPKRAPQLAEAPSRPRKKDASITVARKLARQDEEGGVARVKPNRRSEETIGNILAATEEVVLRSGAERISILDVCQVAGVSRGTFYRYFSSQDDLLDTFSRHKRDSFHSSLAQAVGGIDDPDARLNALIAYLDDYLDQSRAQRLLMVAPEYALGFFRRIFHDSVVRFQDVLGIVFDQWEERLGVRLDRELICELIIRYVMSETLVSEPVSRRMLPIRVRKLIAALAMGPTVRSRR